MLDKKWPFIRKCYKLDFDANGVSDDSHTEDESSADRHNVKPIGHQFGRRVKQQKYGPVGLQPINRYNANNMSNTLKINIQIKH